MVHLIYFGFLFVVSLLYALIEIQIEGQHGWAEKLPTWRIRTPWTDWLFSERPLTGYHLYFFLFIIIIAHAPYALSFTIPSITSELRMLSFIVLFFILEDFLWFVFNPAFGIRRFASQNIWWHSSRWWWIMPRDYWLYIPLGLLLYYLSYALA
jgi:hypothetical protein